MAQAKWFNSTISTMPVSYTHLDVYKRQAMDKGYDFYQDGAAVGDYMYVDTNGDGYISCLLYTSTATSHSVEIFPYHIEYLFSELREFRIFIHHRLPLVVK